MEDQHPKEKQQQPLCEECKEKPSKYKCPGCSLRSCSLPCVNAHKQRSGCSGKRNQTHFVPLSQFNDHLLLSDYNFLEETKRVSESAKRMRVNMGAYHQFRLPVHLWCLRGAAARRKIKLLFLPSGMSKREKNQSRYVQRKKFITWTIEWRFHNTDVVLFDHGIHEDRSLHSVIKQHLSPGPWNHRLKQFCEGNLDALKFFIRKYPKGPKSPFCELNVKAPLKQQLTNITILEYPVIYVFLPSNIYNFEVIKGIQLVAHVPESNNLVPDDLPSPNGVPFREEEIEELNGYSDTRVYDFAKSGTPSPPCKIPHDNMAEKSLSRSSDCSFLKSTAAGSNSCDNSKSLESVEFDDMDFDFDQGLMDAYSDITGQVNPDSFFDFEGEILKDEKVNGRADLPVPGQMPLVQEELEEGEIVE